MDDKFVLFNETISVSGNKTFIVREFYNRESKVTFKDIMVKMIIRKCLEEMEEERKNK